MNKKQLGIFITLLLGVLIINSLTLMRFPRTFTDEAWLISRAWSYLETGLVFGQLDAGVIERFEGYWTYMPFIPTWIQSLPLRITDTPDLFLVRIVSLFFGMILLLAAFSIGYSINGYLLGILSVILVAFSRPFLTSAHLARTDIMAAAIGFGAIAFILWDKFSRWWIGLISGLLIGLAVEIHPNSVIYIPAIVFIYFFYQRRSSIKSRHFWSFFVGLFFGALVYLTLHVFPYPETYINLSKILFESTHIPPIMTGDIQVILFSLLQTSYLIIILYFLSSPLILVAGFLIFRKGEKNFQMLVYLSIVFFVGSILLIRNKIFYYGILFSPIIDILLATLVMVLINWLRSNNRLWRIVAAVYLGLIISTLIINQYSVIPDRQPDFQKTNQLINESVEPTDVILGHQIYWFGLENHEYYSWEELIYYQRYAPGSDLQDAFREFKPDIFIIDGHLRGYISDVDGASAYSKYLRLPAAELAQFLDENARLIDKFDGGIYGTIEIYKIEWKSTS